MLRPVLTVVIGCLTLAACGDSAAITASDAAARMSSTSSSVADATQPPSSGPESPQMAEATTTLAAAESLTPEEHLEAFRSQVAGVYRLSETSARNLYAGTPAIERFESAAGEIVIAEDGGVLGDFDVVWFGLYDGASARVTASYTLLPSSVGLGDAGLEFPAQLAFGFTVEPTTAETYVNEGGVVDVVGLVDPEVGMVEVRFVGHPEGFEFLR